MMTVASIEEKMSVLVFGGMWQGDRLVVGDDLEVVRHGTTVVTSMVSGVLVGGRVMDQADAGQEVQVLLRGPAAREVRVGDELRKA